MSLTFLEPPLKSRELESQRLMLRPLAAEDEAFVQRCYEDPRIALGMGAAVPYPAGGAAKWIARLPKQIEEGTGLAFVAKVKATDELAGALGCNMDLRHCRATLWYWLDVPFWNKGLCTEAARTLVDYAFRELGIHRVQAHHHVSNTASGNVMRKLGMRPEGLLRKHSRRGDAIVDCWIYSVLREEWLGEAAAD